MRVIATVGLPGSGKGEAAAVATELDVPVVTMGDVIRAACRDRGLDPATHHGAVAKALREENGPAAVAERSIPIIEKRLVETDADTVLVDGVRSGTEVDRFEAAFGDDFTLLSIDAPFEVRTERVSSRGRDASAEEGGESVAERDARERGFGMDAAISRADVSISNTDSLDAFRTQVEAVLRADSDALDRSSPP